MWRLWAFFSRPTDYFQTMTNRFSSKKGPTQRQLRAGEVIRHALVEIIQREGLRDPALEGVSVTISEVQVSPDLKQARVFASPLGGGDDIALIAALNRAAAFLRGMLGKRIEMKFTPALIFVADQTFMEAQKIESLLARPDVVRDLDGE